MIEYRNRILRFFSLYGVCLAVLSGFAMAWYLRYTPFRAEHWGLLHQMETAPSLWESIRRVAMFVCYSVGRYQPLAFFPTALGYWVFGFTYFAHYLLAATLHFFTSVQFASLYGHFIGCPESSIKEVLRNRSLEILWFFTLFVAADVMAWTFYLYVELAVFCGVTALLRFWQGRNSSAVFLAILSTLLYEPFIVLCAVMNLHLAVRCFFEKKWRADFLVLLGFQLMMVLAYSGSYHPRATSLEQVLGGILGKTLYTRHDALKGVAWAGIKPFFVFYNGCLMAILSLKSFLLPTFAVKLNIYEMPVPEILRGSKFFYFAWLFFGASVWSLYRLSSAVSVRRLWTVAFIFIGLFAVIAWSRNEDGIFPAVQIRYHYLVAPFLGVLFLAFIRFTRRFYSVVLVMLICINLGSSWDHFSRVKHDMQEISEYLHSYQSRGATSQQLVQNMVDGMIDIQIPYREDNLFFTYNARGALSRR